MTELAVPWFMVTILMTPLIQGLPILLFRMLSVRDVAMYEQLGSPSFLGDWRLAWAQLGRFLYSRMPEQLKDRSTYVLANTLRILLPLYVCTAIPLLYRLVLGPAAA